MDTNETVSGIAAREKIDLLNKEADEQRKNFPAKSLEICQQAIQLASGISYRIGLAKANFTAGISSRLLSNFDKSFRFYDIALNIFVDCKDLDGESRTLNAIGNVHYSLGNYTEAISYFKKS